MITIELLDYNTLIDTYIRYMSHQTSDGEDIPRPD